MEIFIHSVLQRWKSFLLDIHRGLKSLPSQQLLFENSAQISNAPLLLNPENSLNLQPAKYLLTSLEKQQT